MCLGRHHNAICRRKLNAPPEWEAFRAEVLRDGSNALLYEGAIAGRRTRGPNKGQLFWTRDAMRNSQKVVLTDDEVRAEMRRYELDTGKCCACFGDMVVSAGWSRDTGPKTKLCERCNGTGKAQVKDTP